MIWSPDATRSCFQCDSYILAPSRCPQREAHRRLRRTTSRANVSSLVKLCTHADVSSKSPRRHYKDPTCDRQPHRLSGTRPHSRTRFHKYVSGDFAVGEKTRRSFSLPSFTRFRAHVQLYRSTLSSSLEICSTRTSLPGTVFTRPSRFCGSTR